MRQDPLLWLERLLEVNAKSDFTAEQKIVIASAIRTAMQKLGAHVLSVR